MTKLIMQIKLEAKGKHTKPLRNAFVLSLSLGEFYKLPYAYIGADLGRRTQWCSNSPSSPHPFDSFFTQFKANCLTVAAARESLDLVAHYHLPASF